jgi:multidrug efflux pump subunit AcrB
MLATYDRCVARVLAVPGRTLAALGVACVASVLIYPRLGLSFFPPTDAGEFVINVKAPSGTRLDQTESKVAALEDIIRRTIAPSDLDMVVSNIGVDPGFSSLYTTNAAMHTAFVRVALKPGHRTGSYEYMAEVKARLNSELPELRSYFSSGSLVDAVLNLGLPAPIDVQVSGSDLAANYRVAQTLSAQIRALPGAGDVYVPQDLDYPALRLDIDRTHAAQLGLSEREVVTNVITALTSNQMVAPSTWLDPLRATNYLLTVQYPEQQIRSLADLQAIPLRGAGMPHPTRLDMVADLNPFDAPTEIDHYQIRRVIDAYVRPAGEDIGNLANRVDEIIARTTIPPGVSITLRGMVEGMRNSFRRFAVGLLLSLALLYLILVAQFRSWIDPFIILLAVPPGFAGVLLTLWTTGTTLNVMSLMGVLMLAGIAVSNSILIVEFAHRLVEEGAAAGSAVARACRVRLRPVLMTSLATVLGLLPMALKLGEGSESYAPLARALIGGLMASVACTVFVVPAGFYLAYRSREPQPADVTE